VQQERSLLELSVVAEGSEQLGMGWQEVDRLEIVVQSLVEDVLEYPTIRVASALLIHP
jgi:hypothetical protein